MVDIFGKKYFISVQAIDEICKIEKGEDDEEPQVNIFLYDIVKMCVERVLNDNEIVDDDLGRLSFKDLSISFRLAFNTLIKYNILIESEDNYDDE